MRKNSPRRFEESQEDMIVDDQERGVERLLTRLRRHYAIDIHFFEQFLGNKHRKLLSFGDFRRGLAHVGIFPKSAYLYAVFELLDSDHDGRFTRTDLTRVLETKIQRKEEEEDEEEEDEEEEENEYDYEKRYASMIAARVALNAAASSTKNAILSEACVDEKDSFETSRLEEDDRDFIIHTLKLASWITVEEIRRLVGMNASEVLHYRSVLEKYFDNKEDGTMSRKSFEDGFNHARETSSLISNVVNSKTQQDIDRTRVILAILFDVVDFDGDGEVGAFELNGALTALMSGSLIQRAKIAFVLFDSKRKGQLSRSDLTRLLAAEICVSRRIGCRCNFDSDISKSPFKIAKGYVETYLKNETITSHGYFSSFTEWYCSGLKTTKKKQSRSHHHRSIRLSPPSAPSGLSREEQESLKPPPIPPSNFIVPPPIPKDATTSTTTLSNEELFKKLMHLRAMFKNNNSNDEDDDDRESLVRELQKEKARAANLEAEISSLRKLGMHSPTKKSLSSSTPVSPLLFPSNSKSPKSESAFLNNESNFLHLDSVSSYTQIPTNGISNLKKKDTELLERRLSKLNSSLEAAMNQMDTLERSLS